MDIQELDEIKMLLDQRKLFSVEEKLLAFGKSPHITDDNRLHLDYFKVVLFLNKGKLRQGSQDVETLLEKCRNSGDQELEFDTLIISSLLKSMLGEVNSAERLIERSERLLELLPNIEPQESKLKRRADIDYSRGFLNNRKGDVGISQVFLEKSLEVRESIKDYVGIIDVLYELGYTYHINKRSKRLLSIGSRILDLSKSIENEQGEAKANIMFGLYYRMRSKFNEALKSFEKALEITEKIGDRINNTRAFLNIALVHGAKGDTNLALEYCRRTLDTYKEIGYQSFLAYQYTIIGNFYVYLGDLDKGVEFAHKSLEIFEALGHRRGIATCLNNLGDFMADKGEIKDAMDYFTRSLKYSHELKFEVLISDTLYQLIKYYNDVIAKEVLQEYLEELKEISERHADIPTITQRYRLSKGILLKSHGRLIDKGLAQTIIRQVSEEDIVDLELTVEALINLCEILLFELETTEDEIVLEELNQTSQRLLQISKRQDAEIYIVEAYLIQSKIKVLELNILEAQNLLTQSLILAKEKGLTRMERVISVEEESLTSQLATWSKIIEQQPSMKEIIKLTQVGDLISRIFHKRQFQKEEEVIAYAKNARKLVQGWN